MVLERDIEAYLMRRVKELGGEVRKVQWVNRSGAPDRLVLLPSDVKLTTTRHALRPSSSIWAEVKNPETIKTFPANPHERAQAREHERMRAMGQLVYVVGTFEQVEEMLR